MILYRVDGARPRAPSTRTRSGPVSRMQTCRRSQITSGSSYADGSPISYSSCSATVVTSRNRNLILTAGHCVSMPGAEGSQPTWASNVMFVPDVAMRAGRPNGVGFSVPVDDSHSRILMAMRAPRTPDGKRPMRGLEAEKFKPWHQRTLAERQDQPGDYEAQAGQGPISLHSEEHLVTSDKGIGMQRRMLRRAMETVAAGGDPPGLAFEESAVVQVPSGNFYAG